MHCVFNDGSRLIYVQGRAELDLQIGWFLVLCDWNDNNPHSFWKQDLERVFCSPGGTLLFILGQRHWSWERQVASLLHHRYWLWSSFYLPLSRFTCFHDLWRWHRRRPGSEAKDEGNHYSCWHSLQGPWLSTTWWGQMGREVLLSLSHVPDSRKCTAQGHHFFCVQE